MGAGTGDPPRDSSLPYIPYALLWPWHRQCNIAAYIPPPSRACEGRARAARRGGALPADERASKLAPHHPAPRRGGANRFEDHRRPQRDPEELPPHPFMMMGCARDASSPRSACFAVRSLRALCIHSFGRGRPSAPNAQPHSTFPDAPPLHGRMEDYAHGKKAAFVVVCGA